MAASGRVKLKGRRSPAAARAGATAANAAMRCRSVGGPARSVQKGVQWAVEQILFAPGFPGAIAERWKKRWPADELVLGHLRAGFLLGRECGSNTATCGLKTFLLSWTMSHRLHAMLLEERQCVFGLAACG